MSNEIVLQRNDAFSRALEPSDWDAAMKCGEAIAKVGIGGVKTKEEAVIRIMAGREIGLGAMASLRLVYSIHGKVGYDASLIRARCLQSVDCEYFEADGEVTATSATFKTKRKGRPEQKYTFTMEDAKRAGLTGEGMYTKYPRNMLAARATVNLARLVWPEAVAGMHTPDELASPYAGDPATDPTPPHVVEGILEESSAPPLPDFESEIASADSTDKLNAIAKAIEDLKKTGRLPDDARKALGAKWAARAKELSKPSNGTAQTQAATP